MPTPLIISLAKRARTTTDKVEQAWNKAKADTLGRGITPKSPTYWSIVNAATQRALGLRESLTFKEWVVSSEQEGPTWALLSALFWVRDQAHFLHLATKSFAQHEALGALYDEILPKVDELAELIQGQCGLITMPLAANNPPLMSAQYTDPILWIQETYLWLTGPGRDLIPRVNGVEETAITNVYDEVVALTLRAKYKLENLV